MGDRREEPTITDQCDSYGQQSFVTIINRSMPRQRFEPTRYTKRSSEWIKSLRSNHSATSATEFHI